MFISIYVKRAVFHAQQPDVTPIGNTFYLNPMHIIYVDVEKEMIELSNGVTLWTNKDGVYEVRRSEVTAYVTHNPIQ